MRQLQNEGFKVPNLQDDSRERCHNGAVLDRGSNPRKAAKCRVMSSNALIARLKSSNSSASIPTQQSGVSLAKSQWRRFTVSRESSSKVTDGLVRSERVPFQPLHQTVIGLGLL